MKSEELNLDNPIFVFYINIDGLSRQRSEEFIEDKVKRFDIYKNATMWFIPCKDKETRIECIYDGKMRGRDLELNDLMCEINKRIDILSNSKNFEDFKINIRDWRLSNIIDGKEKE